MRTFLLSFYCALLLLTGLQAQDKHYEIRQLLFKREFGKLDEMYAQIGSGPFRLTEFFPPVHNYFGALTPYTSEGTWEYHELLLLQWHKAHPTSPAAVLALAQLYYDHAWAARGTGYSSQVTEEGRKLYHQLLKKSLDTLMKYSDLINGEPWYYNLTARIFANSGDTFGQAVEMYMALIEKWPGYMDGYSNLAFYLLPRWYGTPEELSAYIEWITEQVGGTDGDMIYSRLMVDTAHMEQGTFIRDYQPDMERIARGFDTMIGKLSLDDRNYMLDRYIRTLQLTQDNERLKSALLMRGPLPFVGVWSNRKTYQALLQRSGAEERILAAWELEKKGEPEQAEAIYLSFDPDAAKNPWLSLFYQRHRKTDMLTDREDTRRFNIPVADVKSMDDVFSLCVIYPTIGNFAKAREAADRFDAERGHNIAGKLAYYQIALYEGNKEAAAKARQSILDLKTDRKLYQFAQAFMSNPDNVSIDSLDWRDPYASHAATAIALYLYEIGRIEEARAFLENGFFNITSVSERNRFGGLYLYPPK